MKKSILTLSFLFAAIVVCFCQTQVIDVAGATSDKNFRRNSKLLNIWYFTYPNANPSVFEQDTLVFYLQNIDSDFPHLKLYDDSRFTFLYNIKSEKKERISFDSGERIQQINQTSSLIKGDYSFSSEKNATANAAPETISFHFESGEISNFKIIKKEHQIILLKQ